VNFGKQATTVAQLEAELSATQAELERLKKELRKEADVKLKHQAALIDKLAKSRFSLGIKSTQIIWEILDWDGDYKVTRTYKGLHVGEGLELHFLKHRAFSSTPNSKFGSARLLPDKSSAGISMEFGLEGNATMFFKIDFPPGLANTEAGADYGFEYGVEKGLLMTREAAREAYGSDPRPREAVYQINEIFNEFLHLELIFPAGYPGKTNCAALIDQIEHAEETARLQITKTDRGVSVEVSNPLPGFWYLIEWDGPPEEEFQRLREEMGN
jgi:hypothetical protein